MRWIVLAVCVVIAGCDGKPNAAASARAAKTAVASSVTVAPKGSAKPSAVPAAAATPATATTHAAPEGFPSLFLGEDDTVHREALRTGAMVKAKKGSGGRTLAFKITLADGTVGYFKPEQTFSGSHWYAEIAGTALDRELGFGRAPPVIGRAFPWAPLKELAGDDPRVAEVIVQPDGTVRGAFVWWIPGTLENAVTGIGWEKWVRHDGPLRISPYQRPQEWKDDRNAGHATHIADKLPAADKAESEERAAELSDLILFDYLTTNVDRWGGDNTNVRTLGKGGVLIYLDNGAGFSPGEPRIPLMDARLEGVQRFRRETTCRIRNLDFDHFRARLDQDPMAPILNDIQWKGLRARHKHLLEHVEAMREKFGDKIFFDTKAPPNASCPASCLNP